MLVAARLTLVLCESVRGRYRRTRSRHNSTLAVAGARSDAGD